MQFSRNEGPYNTMLQPVTFTSKSKKCRDLLQQHRKRSKLGILHSPEKFYHYCFICEVNEITDHKLMVVIFMKGVARLSH